MANQKGPVFRAPRCVPPTSAHHVFETGDHAAPEHDADSGPLQFSPFDARHLAGIAPPACPCECQVTPSSSLQARALTLLGLWPGRGTRIPLCLQADTTDVVTTGWIFGLDPDRRLRPWIRSRTAAVPANEPFGARRVASRKPTSVCAGFPGVARSGRSSAVSASRPQRAGNQRAARRFPGVRSRLGRRGGRGPAVAPNRGLSLSRLRGIVRRHLDHARLWPASLGAPAPTRPRR
jgi:hypothetical protein